MIAMTGAAALSKLCSPKPWSPQDQQVALVQCDGYDQFEARLGVALTVIGFKELVRGKTVALKVNLAGNPKNWPPRGSSHDTSFRTNPRSVQAVISLLAAAGARRIRILESFFPPRQDHALWHNYCLEPEKIHHKGVPIVWENIQNLGNYKNYVQRNVPCDGALLYSSYHLSPALFECDVYVSLAKLKEHWIAGVSMSMKNNFGITPCSLYGGDCGPSGNEQPTKERADVLHNGLIPVPAGVGAEVDPYSSRDPGFRIPRIVVDLLQVRPIHLAIVDGVDSVSGGEGPWIPGLRPIHPRLIIAGRNAVSVDAVGVTQMGYQNPAAARGEPPFVRADNVLRLADEARLGTCDLKKIEIIRKCLNGSQDCFKPASTFKS
jgi:uncharacterized protein (DUF362 family)